MARLTEQMNAWSGEFGQAYTDRNAMTPDQMEANYQRTFGVTRTQQNERFLGKMARSMRILEVGCNIGNQLICLQRMGFTSLYAIELQSHAVELAKARTKNINIIQGAALDIPFKDGFFDLVYTSGVLIHVHPRDLQATMREICRCTRQYIWGAEYYAPEMTEVKYRGHDNLLWKTDYVRAYQECCPCLTLEKEDRLAYAGESLMDTMFLLSRRASS